jgi:hypothetical protein
MTTDLKEAFGIAAVKFVIWSEDNAELRRWSPAFFNVTGERRYAPEPTVRFFGRDFSLSEFCTRADVLTGPLPLFLKSVFVAICNNHPSEYMFVGTYEQAIECLRWAVEEELTLQEQYTLQEPCRELIEKSRRHASLEEAIVAHLIKGHGSMFRFTPNEWRAVLETLQGEC